MNSRPSKEPELDYEVIQRFERTTSRREILETKLLELAESYGWPTLQCADTRWLSGKTDWVNLSRNGKWEHLRNWIDYLEQK